MISSPEREGEMPEEEMEEPQTGCLLRHGVGRGWRAALPVSARGFALAVSLRQHCLELVMEVGREKRRGTEGKEKRVTPKLCWLLSNLYAFAHAVSWSFLLPTVPTAPPFLPCLSSEALVFLQISSRLEKCS